jgi:hypothetical protein
LAPTADCKGLWYPVLLAAGNGDNRNRGRWDDGNRGRGGSQKLARAYFGFREWERESREFT